jgi:hypothetical protein
MHFKNYKSFELYYLLPTLVHLIFISVISLQFITCNRATSTFTIYHACKLGTVHACKLGTVTVHACKLGTVHACKLGTVHAC